MEIGISRLWVSVCCNQTVNIKYGFTMLHSRLCTINTGPLLEKKWISKKQMMNLRMVKCHKRRQRFGTCFVTMVYCTSCLASKPHGWGPSPTWTHPCHLPLEKHVQDSSNKHQVMGRFNSLELTRQIRFVPSNQLQTVNIKKEEHSWTHRPAIKRKQLQTA